MQSWVRYLLWLVVVVLGSVELLSACGHRGDLYLPTAQQQKQEQPYQNK